MTPAELFILYIVSHSQQELTEKEIIMETKLSEGTVRNVLRKLETTGDVERVYRLVNRNVRTKFKPIGVIPA